MDSGLYVFILLCLLFIETHASPLDASKNPSLSDFVTAVRKRQKFQEDSVSVTTPSNDVAMENLKKVSLVPVAQPNDHPSVEAPHSVIVEPSTQQQSVIEPNGERLVPLNHNTFSLNHAQAQMNEAVQVSSIVQSTSSPSLQVNDATKQLLIANYLKKLILSRDWIPQFSRQVSHYLYVLSRVSFTQRLAVQSQFAMKFNVVEAILKSTIERQNERFKALGAQLEVNMSLLAPVEQSILTNGEKFSESVTLAENLALYHAVFTYGVFKSSSMYRLPITIEGEILNKGEVRLSRLENHWNSVEKGPLYYTISWSQHLAFESSCSLKQLYSRVAAFYLVPLSVPEETTLPLTGNYIVGYTVLCSSDQHRIPSKRQTRVQIPINTLPGKYRLVGVLYDVVTFGRYIFESRQSNVFDEALFEDMAKNVQQVSPAYLLPHLSEPVIFAKSHVLVCGSAFTFPSEPMAAASLDNSFASQSEPTPAPLNESHSFKARLSSLESVQFPDFHQKHSSILQLSSSILIDDVFSMRKEELVVPGCSMDFAVKLLPQSPLDRRDFGPKAAVSETSLTILLVHGYNEKVDFDFYDWWKRGHVRPMLNIETGLYSPSAQMIFTDNAYAISKAHSKKFLLFLYDLPDDLVQGLEYRLLFLVHDLVVVPGAVKGDRFVQQVQHQRPQPLTRRLEESIPHLVQFDERWGKSTQNKISLWTSLVAVSQPFLVHSDFPRAVKKPSRDALLYTFSAPVPSNTLFSIDSPSQASSSTSNDEPLESLFKLVSS